MNRVNYLNNKKNKKYKSNTIKFYINFFITFIKIKLIIIFMYYKSTLIIHLLPMILSSSVIIPLSVTFRILRSERVFFISAFSKYNFWYSSNFSEELK